MTPAEIKEAQEFLDRSDMFLVESLHGKSSQELFDMITRLQKEANVVQRSNNQEWIRRHRGIQEVVYVMYRLKSEFEQTNREGHTLA